MHRKEITALHGAMDRTSSQTEVKQLTTRHNPMLPRRKLSNRPIRPPYHPPPGSRLTFVIPSMLNVSLDLHPPEPDETTRTRGAHLVPIPSTGSAMTPPHAKEAPARRCRLWL
jgi:hypothetical protein